MGLRRCFLCLARGSVRTNNVGPDRWPVQRTKLGVSNTQLNWRSSFGLAQRARFEEFPTQYIFPERRLVLRKSTQNLRAPYLNTVRSIVIAAITTATIAIQFAHRTSLRLTSESHLPRARCLLSLLALRNIIRTHLLRCFVSGKVCIEEFFTECREGYSSERGDEFWG